MSEGHFGRSARAPLTLSGAQGLEAGLVAQGELAGLHHQREAAEEDRKRVGRRKMMNWIPNRRPMPCNTC